MRKEFTKASRVVVWIADGRVSSIAVFLNGGRIRHGGLSKMGSRNIREDYAIDVSLLCEISGCATSHQNLSQWRGESPR